MKKKAILAVLILLLIFAAAGTIYYFWFYEPVQVEQTPAYNSSKVRTGDIIITASGVGNVFPVEKVSVGFQNSGVIQDLSVRVGDIVKINDILASRDDSDERLNLSQSESNLYAFFTPEALNQAELSLISAKTNYDEVTDDLTYLISSEVFNAEVNLANAQFQLDQLKANAGSTESEIEASEIDLEIAEKNLTNAQLRYKSVYVVETFAYSFVNSETNLPVYSYRIPTEDEIALARAKFKSAELMLNDAENYFSVLQAGVEDLKIPFNAAPGSSLAKLEQAKLAYDKALADLDRTVIKAPISGTVTVINAYEGQAINNTPFITIETLDELVLKFYVEERDISLIKPGNRIEVFFDAYPDNLVEGTISYLEPAIQTFEGSPVAVVWAVLKDSIDFPLLSGMSADVEVIAAETKNALLVPVQALREIAPGSYSVFVIQPDGSLRMVVVTVGLQDYANAEILSGLNLGDVVSTGAIETK